MREHPRAAGWRQRNSGAAADSFLGIVEIKLATATSEAYGGAPAYVPPGVPPDIRCDRDAVFCSGTSSASGSPSSISRETSCCAGRPVGFIAISRATAAARR